MAFTRHLRENLTFDRAWPIRDAVDHIGVEDVETCINLIGNECLWFFNKSFDLSISFRDHNAILTRVFDFSYHDCALLAMLLVEFNQFFERVFTDHI